MAWEKVPDLGPKMLFVSHPTFSAAKIADAMENNVYFPRFRGKGGVFYSLASHKYEKFGTHDSKTDFSRTEEQQHCSWIEPTTITVTWI